MEKYGNGLLFINSPFLTFQISYRTFHCAHTRKSVARSEKCGILCLEEVCINNKSAAYKQGIIYPVRYKELDFTK